MTEEESGMSVVPMRTTPCQGIAKMTRPSSVSGTMRALVAPKEVWAGTTMWVPRDDGEERGTGGLVDDNGGSSEKMPVALMTHLARTTCFGSSFLVVDDGSGDACSPV